MPWSQNLQSRDFQSHDPSIAVYATTYQYHPTPISLYQISTSFLEERSLTRLISISSLKGLLADQRLFWSGDGRARIVAHALESHRRSRRRDERKRLPERSQYDFCDVNVSVNQPLLSEVVMVPSYQAEDLITCQG